MCAQTLTVFLFHLPYIIVSVAVFPESEEVYYPLSAKATTAAICHMIGL